MELKNRSFQYGKVALAVRAAANRYFPCWKILFLSSSFKKAVAEKLQWILLKFATFAPER